MFIAALTLSFVSGDGTPYVVGGGGDLDGDGLDDFVLGFPTYESSPAWPDSGRARVYLGASDGQATLADDLLGVYTEELGTALAIVGDTNNDGFDDLLVSGPGRPTTGRAYLYEGDATGVVNSPEETWSGSGGGRIGTYLAGGNFDGDAFGDVVVGEPFYSISFDTVGSVDVYLGANNGVRYERSYIGFEDGMELGSELAVGDFDADGFDDIAMGSQSFVNGSSGVYIYEGGNNLPNAFAVHIDGVYPDRLETGDFDGDGYDDIAFTDGGELWVTRGSSTGLGFGRTLIYDRGTSVAGSALRDQLAVADYNGDGYDDIFVGNTLDDVVRVFAGRPDGPSTFFQIPGAPFSDFGYGVQGVGDTNGDGYDDVVILAPGDGEAILYLGFADDDGDGDGLNDCDPADPLRSGLDTDGDGFSTCDGDCDDTDADELPGVIWYVDDDKDGYGDPATASECERTTDDDILDGSDCDDSDPNLNPTLVWHADKDGDGWGDPNDSATCEAPDSTWILDDEDCDDNDPDEHPGAVWHRDGDGDGFGAGAGVAMCERSQPSDVLDNTDCDDDDAARYPGADDIPGNGVDEDCDGVDAEGGTSTDPTVPTTPSTTGGDDDDDDDAGGGGGAKDEGGCSTVGTAPGGAGALGLLLALARRRSAR